MNCQTGRGWELISVLTMGSHQGCKSIPHSWAKTFRWLPPFPLLLSLHSTRNVILSIPTCFVVCRYHAWGHQKEKEHQEPLPPPPNHWLWCGIKCNIAWGLDPNEWIAHFVIQCRHIQTEKSILKNAAEWQYTCYHYKRRKRVRLRVKDKNRQNWHPIPTSGSFIPVPHYKWFSCAAARNCEAFPQSFWRWNTSECISFGYNANKDQTDCLVLE